MTKYCTIPGTYRKTYLQLRYDCVNTTTVTNCFIFHRDTSAAQQSILIRNASHLDWTRPAGAPVLSPLARVRPLPSQRRADHRGHSLVRGGGGRSAGVPEGGDGERVESDQGAGV